MKKLVVAAITLSLAGGGIALCSTVGTTSPIRAAVQEPPAPTQVSFVPEPIEWFVCWENTLTVGVFPGECGYLKVPLDYAHPDGTTIDIAVTKIEHSSSAAEYQGVMVVNPGGPGKQGIAMPLMGKQVPHAAGNAYDWIGFDPRGVGFSRPRLSCDQSPRPGADQLLWSFLRHLHRAGVQHDVPDQSAADGPRRRRRSAANRI